MRLTQTELKRISKELADRITTASDGNEYFAAPYRHLVIDNFLPPDFADAVEAGFPDLNSDCWEFANDADIEVKYRTTWQSEFDIPEALVDCVRLLNSATLLRAMATRIGIQKLVPDPYFSGGGLNITLPGGLLDVHVDGNYHDATGLNRRLNAILYLNRNWQPGWGGEFGIYDSTGEICVKALAPLFNRLVIFDSHDYSFHGLPEPLKFPPGESRKSVILYYYTKEPRPSAQISVEAPHSALWKKRNLRDKRGSKTRDFF